MRRWDQMVSRIDEQMGFSRYDLDEPTEGWLINMRPTLVPDAEWVGGRSGVDFYFIQDDGSYFKTTLVYSPYFYIRCRDNAQVETFLRRKFENVIEQTEVVEKEDLDQPNHLGGMRRTYLKLVFRNVQDLVSVCKAVSAAVIKHKQDHGLVEHEDCMQLEYEGFGKNISENPGFEGIVDIREYDVPYYMRTCIDMDLRAGYWYLIHNQSGRPVITRMEEQHSRPDPVVLAFDIETTKLPLKFPDSAIDSIMMISYMIDGKGFLIVNREHVSEDIQDFEYTPKPDYRGVFTIFNEANEKSVLVRFFDHVQRARPTIFATYNGDSFDWPFIEARAAKHGIEMNKYIGVFRNSQDEYESSYAVHMDVYRWVKRDSYLPAGSQGLKAVTSIKLGYNPLEVDPESMVRFAKDQPQTLASYSVSDAVCTYYLYMKYVHPFIFSLCNIIPLRPDDVLRKGAGTLCETLLMAKAYHKDIIMPNKREEETVRTFNGHVLVGETYVGGHVEAIESGVFRVDLPVKFKCSKHRLDQIILDLDNLLEFGLRTEYGIDPQTVENMDQVRRDISNKLHMMGELVEFEERPLIYHLDVSAMYPNIMLTNRLQPSSIVDSATCAVCDFNYSSNQCQRKMRWSWRGEYLMANSHEVRTVRNQLENESFPENEGQANHVSYLELDSARQSQIFTKRLTEYCKKVYKRISDTKVVTKESIVCMKENPFYVDTVRTFRDKRYELKRHFKDAKTQLDQATSLRDLVGMEEARKAMILYESLQLAYKCILNSFYGYSMRKGSRWYSMEMAGIVCEVGGEIIRMARETIEVMGGRPLELDTDGIWCMLPSSFPDTCVVRVNGQELKASFPCMVLNKMVHEQFTNHQYHQVMDYSTKEYRVCSENSIFFEIDGPYRAMILPASTEEDRLLKKRYAVFDTAGKLCELKGFEVKRRGELKLIKVFQGELFHDYLLGSTLEECYRLVSERANIWYKMLSDKGRRYSDHELFEYLSERKSMSKSLKEYGAMKSTAITTARRLSEFLGPEMVQDKGLACTYIVVEYPKGEAVAGRAVPVEIFSTDEQTKARYLRKWLRTDKKALRDILDWNYYLERFTTLIQKLITIPAIIQQVPNPMPHTSMPGWAVDKGRSAKTLLDFGCVAVQANSLERLPKLEMNRIEPDLDCWDVLQIRPTAKTGECKMWIFDGQTMGSVVVNMPPVVYVNSRVANRDNDDLFTPVHRQLPRNLVSGHVYKVSVGSADKRLVTNMVQNLQFYPEIDGVYEARVPTLFRLISRYGNAVEPTTKDKVISHKTLSRVETVRCLSSARLEFVYLWGFGIDKKPLIGTSFMVIVILPRFNTILVFSQADSCTLSKDIVAKLYSRVRGEYPDHKAIDRPEMVICNTRPNSLSKTVESINTHVAKYLGGDGFVVICESNREEIRWLLEELVCVENCPRLSVPGSSRTMTFDQIVSWQRHGTEMAFRKYCSGEWSRWVDEQLAFSRICQVPVCNLYYGMTNGQFLGENGKRNTLINVIFDRILKKRGFVSWCSDQYPDFGEHGSSEAWIDHVSLLNETLDSFIRGKRHCDTLTTNPLFSHTAYFDERGLYENCSVQIDVSGWMVNAVLEQEYFDVDKAARCQFRYGELVDDDSLKPIFNVIKMLVDQLSKQGCLDNRMDVLLKHFEHWMIETRVADLAFHDSRMAQYLVRLKRNNMKQLIRELNRRGIRVVFVSTQGGQIILDSSKQQHDVALAYIGHVLSEMKNVGGFRWLVFTPRFIWRRLVWWNVWNHSGFKVDCNGSETYEQQWNSIRGVPSECQVLFQNIIYKLAGLAPGPFEKSIQVPQDVVDLMFSMVAQAKQNESTSGYPGTRHLICCLQNVTSLYSRYAEHIDTLYRQFLAMIHVSGHSSSFVSTFTVLLYHISCSSCCEVQDIDLVNSDSFECIRCNDPLDPVMVEEKLVEQTRNIVLSFYYQEKFCPHCRIVPENMLQRQCDCHKMSLFVYSRSAGNVSGYLSQVLDISNKHGFGMLGEYVRARMMFISPSFPHK